MTGETQEEGAEGTDTPEEKEVDAVIEMKGSIHVGPFQTEILEGKISQAPTCNTHVLVVPIGCTEVKKGKSMPATLWATGVTCIYHTHHWQQASFDSGAAYD